MNFEKFINLFTQEEIFLALFTNPIFRYRIWSIRDQELRQYLDDDFKRKLVMILHPKKWSQYIKLLEEKYEELAADSETIEEVVEILFEVLTTNKYVVFETVTKYADELRNHLHCPESVRNNPKMIALCKYECKNYEVWLNQTTSDPEIPEEGLLWIAERVYGEKDRKAVGKNLRSNTNLSTEFIKMLEECWGEEF